MTGVIIGVIILLIIIFLWIFRALMYIPTVAKRINEAKLPARKKKILWIVYLISGITGLVLAVVAPRLNLPKYAYSYGYLFDSILILFTVLPLMMFAMLILDKDWALGKIEDKKKKQAAFIKIILFSAIMLLAGLCLWAWLLMKNGIIHFKSAL